MPFEEPDDIASDIRAAFDAPAAAPEPLAPAPELDGDLAAAKAPDQSSEVSNEGDSRARDESGRFAKKEGVANPVEQAQPVVATPQAVAEPPLETIRPPASWSATAKSQFAALDPVIQKEILKREGDIETGKAQWDAKGEKLNRYEALIAPYREKFAVQGLDEFAAINALLNAQTMLEKNPAEAIAYLARQYGAPLPSGPLAQQQAFQPQQQQPDPQYLQLATQVQSLQRRGGLPQGQPLLRQREGRDGQAHPGRHGARHPDPTTCYAKSSPRPCATARGSWQPDNMRTRTRARFSSPNLTRHEAPASAARIRSPPGGRTIVQELDYAENATYQRYSGYEVLNISPSDVFTAAEFDWKQAAVAVTISGLEGDVQNTGPEADHRPAVVSDQERREDDAERHLGRHVLQRHRGLGQADRGPSAPGGRRADLRHRGRHQPRDLEFLAQPEVPDHLGRRLGGFGVEHPEVHERLYAKLVRQIDKPDLILADTPTTTSTSTRSRPSSGSPPTRWRGRLHQPQVHGRRRGLDGFAAGAAGVAASASSGGCPANHMYFLNTDYIHWRPHPSRNMVALDTVQSINQDATVKLIVFAGNMTLSNAFLQGVMFQD
jgi:hypothetical protein